MKWASQSKSLPLVTAQATRRSSRNCGFTVCVCFFPLSLSLSLFSCSFYSVLFGQRQQASCWKTLSFWLFCLPPSSLPFCTSHSLENSSERRTWLTSASFWVTNRNHLGVNQSEIDSDFKDRPVGKPTPGYSGPSAVDGNFYVQLLQREKGHNNNKQEEQARGGRGWLWGFHDFRTSTLSLVLAFPLCLYMSFHRCLLSERLHSNCVWDDELAGTRKEEVILARWLGNFC